MLWKVRFWLIRLIAGNAVVAINCETRPGVGLFVSHGREVFIWNVHMRSSDA
jgi:hypothetical protein